MTPAKVIYYTISVFAFLVLVITIYSASHLPIYSDEVAYKIFLERYFLNGGFKQSVTPYCAEGFLVNPAIPLRPAAVLWSLIGYFGEDWISYRILPLLSLMIIISTLIYNGLKNNVGTAWPSILLIGIGPAIYGLVIFRPEIFILLGGLILFFIFQLFIFL